MAKVMNLEGIRRADAMVDKALALNPNVLDRLTNEDIEMEYKYGEESRVVGIRFPVPLLEWLDDHTRELAFTERRKITRNQVIITFLEFCRAFSELHKSGQGDNEELVQQVFLDLVKKQNSAMMKD